MKRHAASACFRDLTISEYNDLQQSISAGFDDGKPVYVANGQIIIGWHRYQICVENDITPVIRDLGDLTDDEIYTRVSNDELHRRHMSPSERAAAVIKLARVCGREFAEPGRPETDKTITAPNVAADADVSTATARRAIKSVKDSENPPPSLSVDDISLPPAPPTAVEENNSLLAVTQALDKQALELEQTRLENETMRERIALMEDGVTPDELAQREQVRKLNTVIDGLQSQVDSLQRKLADCKRARFALEKRLKELEQ